jgi:hypothetical protein
MNAACFDFGADVHLNVLGIARQCQSTSCAVVRLIDYFVFDVQVVSFVHRLLLSERRRREQARGRY